MKLKIGTLNCQNNLENRTNPENAKKLANYINETKYNILGTQEFTINFTKYLVKNLKNYSIYGKFQYGKLLFGTKFPLIKDFNQSNKIITNLKIIKKKTYVLPWFPFKFKDFKKAFKKKCIMPRLATFLKLNIEQKEIYVLNVHLDYYIYNVQKKQLKYLLKKIKQFIKKGSLVLMGDFNLELDEQLFIDFIKDLEKIGLYRVPISEKTNSERYRSKSAIDHIFLSKEFKILDYGLSNLDEITDHKPVYVDVEY